MTKTAQFFAAATLILGTSAVWAQASGPGPGPADTEVNLLKLEMQSLRGDIEIMKGHIGRLVQYLQQRDSQSIAPQAAPVPGSTTTPGAAGPQLSPQPRQPAT